MTYFKCSMIVAALLLLAYPSAAGTVGPDAFGYSASSAAYQFIDIAGSGNRILAGADDDTQMVDIGFGFHFYGQSYGQTWIGANGLIAFNGSEPGNPNVDFGTTATFNDNPVIAPLNSDWQFYNTDAGHAPDAVYYATLGALGGRQFIVQWNEAFSFKDGPKGATFELVLTEGSDLIQFEYRSVDTGDAFAFGNLATVGIRDTGGDQSGRALVWSYNGSTPIADGTAIEFSAAPAGVPEPGTMLGVAGGLAVIAGVQRRRRSRGARPER